MIFDKNQTKFKDCIQEKVWELATRQVPLDVTLPYVPDEYKSACLDKYNFRQNLFAAMYENPDLFGFKMDPSQPDWINKKQVEFYHWLGFDNYIPEEKRFVVSAEDYYKKIKKFNIKSIEALMAHGYVFEERDGEVIIYNHLYPDMFESAVTDGSYVKVNCDYFEMYSDFRAIAKYRRTYEDLHLVFSDKRRQIAEKINDYCVKNKIMPQQCYYFFKVDYKHKGKLVCVTTVKDKNQYVINIGFAIIGGKAFEMISNEIEKYDDTAKFKEFLVKHLGKCVNCKKDCWKKHNPVEVFGKKCILCDANKMTGIRILDPEESDLKYIFRVLDLRAMVIKESIADQYNPGSG